MPKYLLGRVGDAVMEIAMAIVHVTAVSTKTLGCTSETNGATRRGPSAAKKSNVSRYPAKIPISALVTTAPPSCFLLLYNMLYFSILFFL